MTHEQRQERMQESKTQDLDAMEQRRQTAREGFTDWREFREGK
jgi:hypothetical protein